MARQVFLKKDIFSVDNTYNFPFSPIISPLKKLFTIKREPKTHIFELFLYRQRNALFP